MVKFNDYFSRKTNASQPDLLYPTIYPKQYPSMINNVFQNSPLQNFNSIDARYKQFRESCESNDSFFTMNTLRTAVITASGLVWALAGFIPVTGPVIAAGGGVLNVLLPIIWPEDTESKNQELMCAVGNLIDKKIDATIYLEATLRLEGLGKNIRLYHKMIQEWRDPQSKKSVYKAAEDVRTVFLILHAQFNADMPVLRLAPHLIPIYAKAATLHLSILRDVVLFGKEYGFDDKILNGFYEDLVECIKEYTKQCMSSYTTELNRLKITDVNLEDTKKYPWVKDPQSNYQGIENWNRFNAFRRDMTIGALNLVAIWPTLDPKIYKRFVKTSFSHELYTDIQGRDLTDKFSSNVTLESIERDFVRKPHLFTWLKQIDLQYDEDVEVLSEINLRYSYMNSNVIIPPAIFKGDRWGYGRRSLCTVGKEMFPITKTIVKMQTQYSQKLNAIQFDGTQVHNQCIVQNTPAFTFTNSIPSLDVTDSFLKRISDYRLSWLSGGHPTTYFKESISYIGCAWTDPTVDPSNTLSKRRITQIPAVMASDLYYASVIKGPGNTGGDLVKLLTTGQVTITVTLPKANQEYKLRFRCANEQTSTLLVNSSISFPEFFLLKQNPEYESNLSYKSFQVTDEGSDFILKASSDKETTITLTIDNVLTETAPNETEVILDKIEFLPQLRIPPMDPVYIAKIAELYRVMNWIEGKPGYKKGVYFSVRDDLIDYEDFQLLRYQLEIRGKLGPISSARFTQYNKKENIYYVYIEFITLMWHGNELETGLDSVYLYVVDPEKDDVKNKFELKVPKI